MNTGRAGGEKTPSCVGWISACCSSTRLRRCSSKRWQTLSSCQPISLAHIEHMLFCRTWYKAQCHHPGFPALLQPGEELLPFWPSWPETVWGLAGLCLSREQTDEVSQAFIWCLSFLPWKMGNALSLCIPQKLIGATRFLADLKTNAVPQRSYFSWLHSNEILLLLLPASAFLHLADMQISSSSGAVSSQV